MPVLIAVHLAAARWAGLGRRRLLVVGLALAWLVLWNLDMLRMLARDFGSLTITPAW